MPIIKKKKGIKNSNATTYTISSTVASDPNKTVSTVQVDITNTGGQPIAEPATYVLNYYLEINGMRLFNNTSVVFDGNAVGYEYEMTFTMHDSSGNIIGVPSTGPLLISQAMILA